MNGQRPHEPAYPGYGAACNGCGLCCLTVPCAVSRQYRLWRDGRCRALRYAAGRYWCDVIVNPRRVSVPLSKVPKAARVDAIGTGTSCDHRAAESPDSALELLGRRNVRDELFGAARDTYPRACVVHRDDGTQWVITIVSPEEPPRIRECRDGLPVGPEELLEPAPPG